MEKIIGIRREDKNPWERRVPLIPSHVRQILEENAVEIWMQPSSIRVFSDEDYEKEGAKITEDLSPCSVVLAIKEIPVDFFRPGKVYVFFSHTIKGQPANMPMLKRMMELGCTLIDYERIVDEQGRRLVFFGTQAGEAGMIDTLWALGQRLQKQGTMTPFSRIRLAHGYASLVEAKEEIKRAAWEVQEHGLDPSLAPLVFGFTGYGHVSQGAQEILDLLPVETLSPEEMDGFFRSGNSASNRVYKVVFKEEHMVEPAVKGQRFDLQDYYDHPERYVPVMETYIPYLTVVVNCIYWTPRYPRFISKAFLKDLWSREKPPRLKVIGDISCDVEGAVECTVRATNPGNPVYVYDPVEGTAEDGLEGRGVVVMATDNLPAEIPLESSVCFSSALLPLVPPLVRADFSSSFAECDLPEVLKRAVILYQGNLTPDYAYMRDFIHKHS